MHHDAQRRAENITPHGVGNGSLIRDIECHERCTRSYLVTRPDAGLGIQVRNEDPCAAFGEQSRSCLPDAVRTPEDHRGGAE